MQIKDYKIILASSSPRRKTILEGLDLDFTVISQPDIDESYPSHIKLEHIAEFISQKKANFYKSNIVNKELLITADTIVVLDNKILQKPNNSTHAKEMLLSLSNKTHFVFTGVTLQSLYKSKSFTSITEVTFDDLSTNQINYYVDKYNPTDKSGSYGINEWIGYIAVKNIKGSFYNVMGLPVQELYKELLLF